MFNSLLLISSVLFTYISYNIPILSFLIFISFVPLFYILLYEATSLRESLIYSFIFSLLYYFLNFSWFTRLYPLNWLGFSNTQSLLIVSIGLFIICLKQSITMFLIGFIPNKLRNNELLLLYIPILWTTIEYVQQLGPLALPWIRVYISQYNNYYFIQAANIFGSLSLSFIIILVNMLILRFIISKKLKYLYLIIIIFAIFYSYGYYNINSSDKYSYQVNCSIIQANISPADKWYNKDSDSIINNHLNLSIFEYYKNTPDIIVWGETAIPATLDDNILKKVKNFTSSTNSILVTGCFTLNDAKWYNSIALIDNNDIKYYHKTHLVPFGEYIPLRNFITKFFPRISMINAFGEDITPGNKQNKLSISKYNIGTLICFEGLFSDLSRRIAKDSDFIVLVSNDSWYKDSLGVYQHNAHSVFRAIENNRYILRAANSGVSSIIDNNGIIVKSTEPLRKDIINHQIYANNNRTFYNKFGDWFIYLCISVGIIILKL